VVVPHGGPHSVMPTSFLHSYAYLCVSYNLALLHVNFRGSTGFGTDPLDRYVIHIYIYIYIYHIINISLRPTD
jgi:hypothetical protein